MLSKVEKLQRSVADFLSRREALRHIPVVTDRESSFEKKFDEKLAPKFGMSILVKRPNPTGALASGGTVSFGNVICTVRIVENILTNACGMSAAYVAEVVLKSLITFTGEGANLPWAPVADFPWTQLVGTATTNVVEISVTTSMDV